MVQGLQEWDLRINGTCLKRQKPKKIPAKPPQNGIFRIFLAHKGSIFHKNRLPIGL